MIITDGSLARDKLISENQEQKIMSDSFVSDKNYVLARSSVNLLQSFIHNRKPLKRLKSLIWHLSTTPLFPTSIFDHSYLNLIPTNTTFITERKRPVNWQNDFD